MKEKKQSLVELALSLGFTRAAEDHPIYSDGVVIISTVGAELDKLEQADEEGAMSLEKVSLEEAIRLGFGEPTVVVVKQPVSKVPPRVKQRTGVKVAKPKKEKS